MKLLWVAALILMVSFVASAPSDYVGLLSNGCNSNYGEPFCFTVYNVTNPTTSPITIDTSNFKVKWKTQLLDLLTESLPSIKNLKIERWNGASWVNLNLGSTVTLAAKTSYQIRVSATKVWKSIGDNEWQMDNVDNVISAFGHDYTEYAWWNTTYTYKRSISFNLIDNLNKNTTWVYSANLSDLVTSGKLDMNGTCFRIVNANETGEIPFEYEQANMFDTNYTAWIFQNFTNGGNQTVFGYYSNLTGGCLKGSGIVQNYWNYTGAARVTHFAPLNDNTSQYLDSSSNARNFSANGQQGTVPIIKSPYGYAAMFKNDAGTYIRTDGQWMQNQAQGTVLFWVNMTTANNDFIVARGNGAGLDLAIDTSSQKFSCSIDGTGNRAWDGSTFNLNQWYFIACTWNSTGRHLFRNGVQVATNNVGASALSNNAYPNVTIGGLIGGSGWMDGAISELQIYNRSLSPEEIWILTNSTGVSNGGETNQTIGLAPIVTIIEPFNQTYVAQGLVDLKVGADQPIDNWFYRLNSSGANITFTPNTTIATGFGNQLLEVWANNSNGTGYAFRYFNMTLAPNTIPDVYILYPQNQTYLLSNPVSNLNVSSNQPITQWWYRVNQTGANTSFTPNTTFLGGFGNNLIEVWANNSNGTGYNFTYFNITQYFLINSTSIYAYDEITGLQIYFNATITNGTSSLTTINNLTFTNVTQGFPLGSNTVTVFNASYYQRGYFWNNNGLPQIISAYLIPIGGTSARINFHVQSITGSLIPNTQITAEKFIGSAYVTVGQCNTDSSGTCYIYLDTLSTYRITFAATGYTTLIQSLAPTSTDYTITLSPNVNPTYQPIIAGITLNFTPQYLNSSSTWTIVTFTINAASGDLTIWGLNITYNGTLLYNNELATGSGGSLPFNLSSVNKSGSVYFLAYYAKAGNPISTYLKVYTIGPATNATDVWSLTTLRNAARSAGGGNSLIFVAILFAMLATAFALRFVPVVIGGGFVALVALWVFLPFAIGEGIIFAIILPVLGIIAFVLATKKGRA